MGNYFIYIITNKNKTVLYIGVTNDLQRRMFEHKENQGNRNSFAGRYNCFHLLYWERYDNPDDAIAREKELKKWSRKKKEALINVQNPDWMFIDVESW